MHLRQHAAPTCLAAGVNLILAEQTTAVAQAAGMLALDGRCKTLDAAADGYTRAEACTALWLSASSTTTAVSSTATVLVSGTHVNQDGRSSSLTAPNGPSQQALIQGALQSSDLQPCDLWALELHGTGEAYHWQRSGMVIGWYVCRQKCRQQPEQRRI